MRQLIRTRLRRALVGIPLSIVMVMMGVSLTGCASLGTMFTATAAEKAAAAPKRVPTGAEKFANASDALTGSLEAAAKALKSGKRDAKALAGIAQFAKSLPELDKGVQADFAKTRGILKKIKSAEKDAIQAKVEKQYAERQKTLASKLRTIASAESTAALKVAVASTAKWLGEVNPEEPIQPLGTELPHRMVSTQAEPPVLGSSIAPAYAPQAKGTEPSDLPLAPTADDTTQTAEVQFSAEIRSLATSLGGDPVRMYEYVRNAIDFEPYYGSRRTAEEVLLARAGNDIDTTSLLIALYRVSGVPARYVCGVVDIPVANAENWLGVETPEAAARLLATVGTPCGIVASGGRITGLRVAHTWAEVYLPYEDYRGAGQRTGTSSWIPLDASFKDYSTPPVPRIDIGGINSNTIASALASGSILTSVSVTKCDRVAARAAAQTLVDGMVSAGALSRLRQVTLVRTIEQEHIDLLPSQLPMPVRSVSAEWFSVPTVMKHRVHLALPDGAALTTSMAGLSAKRITVSFVGATQADRDVLAQYQTLAEVPAYQANMRPVVSVDGTVVAVGAPTALGSRLDLRMTATSPSATEDFSGSVTGGGFYTIILDSGAMSAKTIGRHVDRYSAAVDAVQQVAEGATGTPVDLDALMGEMFHIAGQMYFAQLDATYTRLALPWRVSQVHVLSEATVGTAVSTVSLFGTVTSAWPSAGSIDVRRDTRVVESVDGNRRSEADYFRAVGNIGSYLEGRMMEQIYGYEGVSAVRVLEIANDAAIPILAIGPGSADLIDSLEYGPSLKSAVRSAVAAGEHVAIPKKGIDYHGYMGTGWIVIDPVTGSGGFMIADGLGGGKSCDIPSEDASMDSDTFWSAISSALSDLSQLSVAAMKGGALLSELGASWLVGPCVSVYERIENWVEVHASTLSDIDKINSIIAEDLLLHAIEALVVQAGQAAGGFGTAGNLAFGLCGPSVFEQVSYFLAAGALDVRPGPPGG